MYLDNKGSTVRVGVLGLTGPCLALEYPVYPPPVQLTLGSGFKA